MNHCHYNIQGKFVCSEGFTDLPLSVDMKCGPYVNKRCPVGMCCSKNGTCSNECSIDQKRKESIYDNIPPITNDGQCGPSSNTRCRLGECCSREGNCSVNNCTIQGRFNQNVYNGEMFPESTNGRCGPVYGLKCPPGQCCSSYGWCGREDECENKLTDSRFHGVSR